MAETEPCKVNTSSSIKEDQIRPELPEHEYDYISITDAIQGKADATPIDIVMADNPGYSTAADAANIPKYSCVEKRSVDRAEKVSEDSPVSEVVMEDNEWYNETHNA